MRFRTLLGGVVITLLLAAYTVGYSFGINDGLTRAALSDSSFDAGTLLGLHNESALGEDERRKRISLHIAAEVRTFAQSCAAGPDLASVMAPTRTAAADYVIQQIMLDDDVGAVLDSEARAWLRACGFRDGVGE